MAIGRPVPVSRVDPHRRRTRRIGRLGASADDRAGVGSAGATVRICYAGIEYRGAAGPGSDPSSRRQCLTLKEHAFV
jgi:hypothetical protein